MAQGPFPTAAALVAAFKAGEVTTCNSPGWGKPAYNFTWSTTDPLQPPQARLSPLPQGDDTAATAQWLTPGPQKACTCYCERCEEVFSVRQVAITLV